VEAEWQFVESGLKSNSVKLCFLLANNDALLNLPDDVWEKIQSLSEDDYFNILSQISNLKGIPGIGTTGYIFNSVNILTNFGISAKYNPVPVSADLVTSFNASYVDPFYNVKRFEAHLLDCIRLHYTDLATTSSIYRSPYTAIVQASGVGKSKLIAELATRMPVIYISLMQPWSTGFPRRTPVLSSRLSFAGSMAVVSKPDLPVIRLCGIFIAGIRLFRENNFNASAFYTAQDVYKPLDNDSSWYSPHEPFDETKIEVDNALNLLTREADEMSRLWKEHSPSCDSQAMILAIDEARGLLDSVQLLRQSSISSSETTSSFRLIRNALQKVATAVEGTPLRLFAVVTDTSSRISNFVPSAFSDPSSRKNPSAKFQLHRPFYLIANHGIFYNSSFKKARARVASGLVLSSSSSSPSPSSSKVIADNLTIHFTKQCMYSIGRPLWHSREYKGHVDALNFAVGKLMCMGDMNLNIELTSAALLAVLNVRVPLSLFAYGSLSVDLPAQHMRLVSGVSEDRQLVFSDYGPEPVLAAAGMAISQTFHNYKPSMMLQGFRKLLTDGLVDAGGLGERMVAYQYILARDLVCALKQKAGKGDAETFPLITVKELLEQVHSDSVNVLQKRNEENSRNFSKKVFSELDLDIKSLSDDLSDLLAGQVSLIQFMEVKYTPRVEDLLDGFLMGVGILCAAGQAGVDIIIPVMLPEERTSKYTSEQLAEFVKRYVKTTDDKLGGIFKDNVNAVFEDLPNLKDQNFEDLGNVQDMRRKWRSMTSIAVQLFGGEEGQAYIQALLARMTCICIQVKNAESSDSDVDPDVNPSFGRFRGLNGTWENPKCVNPFIAIKHVLQSPKAAIKPMKDSSPLQHGFVLRGYDEVMQPCLGEGVAEPMWQIVTTRANPCIAAGENLGDRFAAAAIVNFQYNLSE